MTDNQSQIRATSFNDLLGRVTPEVYHRLKHAVELGKWPDGQRLSSEQSELCLQAVIAWENEHLPEHQRSGYIPPRAHNHCGGSGEAAEPQPLKWK